MNLCSMLLTRAHARPDDAAIIEARASGDRTVTFGQFESRSARAADALHRLGIEPGARVLLLVPLSIELYVAVVALLRIGALVTLLDPSAGRQHIDRCCDLAQPAVLIAAGRAQALRLISPGLRRIGHKITIGTRWLPALSWESLQRSGSTRDLVDLPPDAPALLTFTSGTTGRPKAAIRSHGLLAAQQLALAKTLQLEPGTRDLTTLAVFVLSNLALGVASVLPDVNLRDPCDIDGRALLDQIERVGPASAVASPALFMNLARASRESDRPMRSFRNVYTGGAPVFWHVLDQLAATMPNARIHAVYGSTEAEPISEIALDELTEADRDTTRRGGGLPAGAPVSYVRLRVIADSWGSPLRSMSRSEFDAACMLPGRIGEIVVTGDHVLKGYLNGHGDDETKFRVDAQVWHRTGDSGYIDAHGRIWLTGRCVAIVSDPLGTTYPLQVEAAAHLLAPLDRVAFARIGESRALVIQSHSMLNSDTLQNLRNGLAWARIDKVLPVRHIPMDRRHNSKVDYRALNKQLRLAPAG